MFFKPVRQLIGFLACALLVTACSQSKDTQSSPRSDAWVSEEVLTQLQEVKAELADIKKHQAEIKALLEQMPVRGAAAAPAVASVNLKGAPVDSARVAVVEFTDFQCPYCARHTKSVLPQIRQAFVEKGLVHYEVRNFPLDFHPLAKGAAVASLCVPAAHYDAFHDWIFNNPGSLNRDAYIAQAKAQGVNTTVFAACLDNPATAKSVDEDIAYGEQLGVSGTPKFFIGTIKGQQIVDVSVITGAVDYQRIEREITRRL